MVHKGVSDSQKSSMDLRVYFLLFPAAFNRYLRRHMNNKSSMDPVVYLFKPLIDIYEGIKTISPLRIPESI